MELKQKSSTFYVNKIDVSVRSSVRRQKSIPPSVVLDVTLISTRRILMRFYIFFDRESIIDINYKI